MIRPDSASETPADVVSWIGSVRGWSDGSTDVLVLSSVAGSVRVFRRESGADGVFVERSSGAAPLTRAVPTDSFAPKLVCATGVEGSDIVVTADTTGSCHVHDADDGLVATGRFSAHKAALMAMASSPQHDLVTGGADGRVKIWRLAGAHDTAKDMSVQQVGEFVCRSAVTSLAVEGDALFCGDEIGFVYLLRPVGVGHGLASASSVNS